MERLSGLHALASARWYQRLIGAEQTTGFAGGHDSVLEIAAAAVCIAVSILYLKLSENTEWFYYTSLYILPSTLLVYVFALNKGIVSELLKNKFVLWLADISPYAYLIHLLVIKYLYVFTKSVLHYSNFNILLAIIISFGLTVLAVYIYLFLEKILTAY